MRMTFVLAVALAAGVALQAQQIVPLPAAPLPQQPPPAAPAAPGQAPTPAPAPVPTPGAQPAVPAPVTPVVPINPRALTGETGLIFTSVRPDRVVDFETVMTYLREALKTTTDTTVQRQWQGFRILKSPEPGANASVVYVWLIDPVEKGADYSIGPILAAAYPEKINEIWKLYQGSLIQQSVMNVNAFTEPVLPATAAPEPAAITGPPAGTRPAPPVTAPPVTTPPVTAPPVTPPPAR